MFKYRFFILSLLFGLSYTNRWENSNRRNRNNAARGSWRNTDGSDVNWWDPDNWGSSGDSDTDWWDPDNWGSSDDSDTDWWDPDNWGSSDDSDTDWWDPDNWGDSGESGDDWWDPDNWGSSDDSDTDWWDPDNWGNYNDSGEDWWSGWGNYNDSGEDWWSGWGNYNDSGEDWWSGWGNYNDSGEDWWNPDSWGNYSDSGGSGDDWWAVNWINSPDESNSPAPAPAPEPQPIIPSTVLPAVPSSCGQTKYYFHASNPVVSSGVRVVGGTQTEPNKFPWLVRLAGGSGNTQCGATVIDKDWVLTAAHCVGRSSIYAHFGDHDTRNTDIGEIRMVIRPNQIYAHSGYDDDSMDNDFALLKLPRSLTFSDKIQPVCLPRGCGDGCDKPGQAASIHGWGDLEEDGQLPNILQEATVFIRSFESCQRSYRGGMTEQMLCAGVQGGGVDTCQGDSGGPFVINEDGFNKLCGVVSWGYGCARPESPGVYAKVCTALGWIQNTMRAN